MRHLTRAATFVASVASVLATATPAAADVVYVSDARGDAPARYDIVKVRVNNADDRFVVKTRVRDLKAQGIQIFGFTATLAEGSASYMVTTVLRPTGKTTANISGYIDGESQDVSCKVTRIWSPASNTITLAFDRDCLEPGRVRVNTCIGAGNGRTGDPADFTDAVSVRQG